MLLQGVLHAFQFADMTLAQAFAGATTIPARLLGLPRTSFPPRVGRRADFIVLDIDKSQLRWRAAVHAVFINGARVTPRPIASRPGSW
jgi:cytosine/adenosine deaminase-related metal-dependent hydrolase